METYIKDLNLSPEVKTALSWGLQITKVSDLEGLNYLTFANKCPKGYNSIAIANELNSLGYLYPPENEISVYDVLMSKRLQNVLIQNNILYLSQLSMHPREKILKFRNLGGGTMPELDSICQKYGIQIRSLASIKEAFDSCHFPAMLHTIFFQNNIFCVVFEDWEDKYLFEILPKKETSLMWKKYEISTVSQFSDYNNEQLKEMFFLSPKLLDTIGHC